MSSKRKETSLFDELEALLMDKNGDLYPLVVKHLITTEAYHTGATHIVFHGYRSGGDLFARSGHRIIIHNPKLVTASLDDMPVSVHPSIYWKVAVRTFIKVIDRLITENLVPGDVSAAMMLRREREEGGV